MKRSIIPPRQCIQRSKVVFQDSFLIIRLRKILTAPGWRNQGIGTGLIRYLLEDLRESNQVKPIWSNARVKSARFYRKLGWREVSEQFENGNAGLSVTMLREENRSPLGRFRGLVLGRRLARDDAEVGAPETSKSLAHSRSAKSPSQNHAFVQLPAFIWECCTIGALGLVRVLKLGIGVRSQSNAAFTITSKMTR